ncbi:hypothetical protein QA584_23545 [Anaerocolumna sp. AGMB13025]|uniref:hypothetical protein n=1 Tax=Anaerocolumna sp. AGMB13025 TaxID=3039116 RepID=UPI00241EB6EB|nr:hypothetical protein [Anaerocolumna sp. AGMB13025]WFR56559.1 hypothetical protein QA584_23545 [Anaerocolumna sp. AGMB13025]
MNGWSKNSKGIYLILAVLFCMTILASEIKNYHIDSDTTPLPSSNPDSVSEKSPKSKNSDCIVEMLGILADEINAGITSGNVTILAYRSYSLKDLIPGMIFLYFPFVLWALMVALRIGKHVNRMYLIIFIHNSDGEKGLTEGILAV